MRAGKVRVLGSSNVTPRLIEATGTLHATSGNEMGYQLTDAGKARALDALPREGTWGELNADLHASAPYRRELVRQFGRDVITEARACRA